MGPTEEFYDFSIALTRGYPKVWRPKFLYLNRKALVEEVPTVVLAPGSVQPGAVDYF